MNTHLALRLITIIGIIEVVTIVKGDELFGVYRPAYINPTTGKGFSSANVVWNLNSLAEDKQGRLFSILDGVLVQIDPYTLTLTPMLTLNGLGSASSKAAIR